MPTFTDYLNRYRSKVQAEIPTSQGGEGAQSRNLQAEFLHGRATKVAELGAMEAGQQSASISAQQAASRLQQSDAMSQMQQGATEMRNNYTRNAASILSNMNNTYRKLEEGDRLDQMEQVARNLRLADEKYRYNIEDIGRRQRLDTTLGMKEAIRKSTWENEISILQGNYNFQKMLDAQEGQFQKYLATIDIDTALAIATGERKAAEKTAMYSAGGTAIATGIDWGWRASQSGSGEKAGTSGEGK